MSAFLKNALGHVPVAAAIYDAVRPQRPRTRYNLEQLSSHLPEAVAQATEFIDQAETGKRLVIFATLHYWIEQAVIIGLILRGMGHDVTVAYLPYSNWNKEINGFDLQRQDLYTRRVLEPAKGILRVASLLDLGDPAPLSPHLLEAVDTAATFDAMYTMQLEEIERHSPLFELRRERNAFACRAALNLLHAHEFDGAVIPNGLVTELGIIYQAARSINIPTITYEFNDQREQIWLAQDDIVMRQNTDDLWNARRGIALTEGERHKIADLEDARSSGGKYGKGTRSWQDVPTEGVEELRRRLDLDGRPIVLMAANVLGDSLTLGRHVFASSMAEWIERTVRYFAARQDVQLVIRVHPGERLIRGPSITAALERAFPTLPEHIHIIAAADTTNTYDLMEAADVGLAYTTTVGMEMAMRGVPVIVAGDTHYRGRGFTLDPSSWAEYIAVLNDALTDVRAHRLTREQVETAWNYAYRFFFQYPFDFPWRLMHFWKDFQAWPIKRVLSAEGRKTFGRTFSYLAGETIEW